MSREIKFRAWNRRLKVMSDYVSAIQNGDTQGTPSSINVVVKGIQETWDIKHDDVILEQHTGLHDKNGKEIYEGDIIKYTSEDDVFFYAKVKYFADEDYPAFDFLPPDDDWDFQSNCLSEGVASDCLEVAGDIHTNPELLEEY